MTVVRVAHVGADYEVVVGDLTKALPRLKEKASGLQIPVISDDRVFPLYGELLGDTALADPILVPEGEAAKDWRTLAYIVDQLAALDVKRGTPIIALGGGSVGDVTGLAASQFKRGCPIIHVPTTLLAQADSAIGGKTAINAAGQKNLVGTFHHPLLVIADPALLDSLDSLQLRSGYAEVVKYGLVGDPDFFDWCEANGARLLDGDREARHTAIEHCVQAKARFVTADPDDTSGIRALLNFGHTFGHAIEAVADHALLHGEAVAIGITLAFEFSTELGICAVSDTNRVRMHLRAVGLPTKLSDVGLETEGGRLLEAMLTDKKSSMRGLALILTKGIGKAFLSKVVEVQRLSNFLANQA